MYVIFWLKWIHLLLANISLKTPSSCLMTTSIIALSNDSFLIGVQICYITKYIIHVTEKCILNQIRP